MLGRHRVVLDVKAPVLLSPVIVTKTALVGVPAPKGTQLPRSAENVMALPDGNEPGSIRVSIDQVCVLHHGVPPLLGTVQLVPAKRTKPVPNAGFCGSLGTTTKPEHKFASGLPESPGCTQCQTNAEPVTAVAPLAPIVSPVPDNVLLAAGNGVANAALLIRTKWVLAFADGPGVVAPKQLLDAASTP